MHCTLLSHFQHHAVCMDIQAISCSLWGQAFSGDCSECSLLTRGFLSKALLGVRVVVGFSPAVRTCSFRDSTAIIQEDLWEGLLCSVGTYHNLTVTATGSGPAAWLHRGPYAARHCSVREGAGKQLFPFQQMVSWSPFVPVISLSLLLLGVSLSYVPSFFSVIDVLCVDFV